MKKRLLTCVLTFVVAVAMLVPAGVFAADTTSATPSSAGATSLKWERSLGAGWSNSPTPPAVIGSYIYSGANGYVYKLNKDTGAVVGKSAYLGAAFGYAMMPVVGDEKGIYISTSKTQIVKLDADNLSVRWTSSAFGGQNVCPLYYDSASKRVYTGTWGDDNDGGTYFCVDADTGSTLWSIYDKEGFYWAGAMKVNGRIIFGSESKLLYSVGENATASTLAADKKTATMDGPVRCTPALYERGSGRVFVTTGVDGDVMGSSGGAGYLHRLTVENDGSFSGDSSCSIGSSKNTPVVCGSYVFVSNDKGQIMAIDKTAASLSVKRTVTAPAAVKGELLVASDPANSFFRVYGAYNSSVGGLYYAEFSSDCSSIKASGVMFTPAHRQYSISPVTCDSAGTLYYKNDSGYIMAVVSGANTGALSLKAASRSYNSVKLSWNGRENVKYYYIYTGTGRYVGKTTSTSYTAGNLKTNKKYSFKVRAGLLDGRYTDYSAVRSMRPVPAAARVTTRAGAGKVTVKWSRVSGASGYFVYRAAKKTGRYVKVKSIKSKSWTNTRLKKGKYYYYKVRAYRVVGGKKVFGIWSNISYKKTK